MRLSSFPSAESPGREHIKTILGMDNSTSLEGSTAIEENPPFDGSDNCDDFLNQPSPVTAAESNKRWANQPQ